MAYNNNQKFIDVTHHLHPNNVVKNREMVLNYLCSIHREGMDKLIEFIDKSDYFLAPASTKYHGNYVGGLCKHSLDVLRLLLEKNERYKLDIPKVSCAIVALLHDLCKVNFYKKDEFRKKIGNEWITYVGYGVEEECPLGHGEKSVMLVQRFIKLTNLEMMLIRWHMGCPNEYMQAQTFHNACSKYPAIVAMHTADFEASTYLDTVIDLTNNGIVE